MQRVSLLGLNGEGHIPALDGSLGGNDLENMCKCIHLNGEILDHLERMSIKRVLLTSPRDTEYSDRIVDIFSKSGLERIKNKAEIL